MTTLAQDLAEIAAITKRMTRRRDSLRRLKEIT